MFWGAIGYLTTKMGGYNGKDPIIHHDSPHSPQKDVRNTRWKLFFFTALLTKIHRQTSTRVLKKIPVYGFLATISKTFFSAVMWPDLLSLAMGTTHWKIPDDRLRTFQSKRWNSWESGSRRGVHHPYLGRECVWPKQHASGIHPVSLHWYSYYQQYIVYPQITNRTSVPIWSRINCWDLFAVHRFSSLLETKRKIFVCILKFLMPQDKFSQSISEILTVHSIKCLEASITFQTRAIAKHAMFRPCWIEMTSDHTLTQPTFLCNFFVIQTFFDLHLLDQVDNPILVRQKHLMQLLFYLCGTQFSVHKVHVGWKKKLANNETIER